MKNYGLEVIIHNKTIEYTALNAQHISFDYDENLSVDSVEFQTN